MSRALTDEEIQAEAEKLDRIRGDYQARMFSHPPTEAQVQAGIDRTMREACHDRNPQQLDPLPDPRAKRGNGWADQSPLPNWGMGWEKPKGEQRKEAEMLEGSNAR
jgi:hypothetical protein